MVCCEASVEFGLEYSQRRPSTASSQAASFHCSIRLTKLLSPGAVGVDKAGEQHSGKERKLEWNPPLTSFKRQYQLRQFDLRCVDMGNAIPGGVQPVPQGTPPAQILLGGFIGEASVMAGDAKCK